MTRARCPIRHLRLLRNRRGRCGRGRWLLIATGLAGRLSWTGTQQNTICRTEIERKVWVWVWMVRIRINIWTVLLVASFFFFSKMEMEMIESDRKRLDRKRNFIGRSFDLLPMSELGIRKTFSVGIIFLALVVTKWNMQSQLTVFSRWWNVRYVFFSLIFA